jgi:hypothetical protein
MITKMTGEIYEIKNRTIEYKKNNVPYGNKPLLKTVPIFLEL